MAVSRWMQVGAAALTTLSLSTGGFAGNFADASTSTGIHPEASKSAANASKPVSDTVQWNTVRQVIEGFGGSGAFGMAQSLQSLPNSERTGVLNLLFSPTKGIGLTIVRSLVNDGVDGTTIEPSPGQWDWNLLPDPQIWLMKVAKKYGATTLMSTPWSPPAWMKENYSVAGDGIQSESQGNTLNKLKPSDYHAYAEYLANYVNGYWSHFHIKINVISIQNEPNWNASYASCIWTPEEFHTFIKNDLIPVFKQKHVTAKVMMPETLNWSEDYALPTLEDPVTAKAVSIVAAHGYAGDPAPFTVAQSLHKQVWETEDSNLKQNDPTIKDGLYWATTINQYLTVADVNAWNYWWLLDTYSDGGGLIYVNSTGTISLTKRLFTLGNYSRFVRPGFYRISAPNNPAPGVLVSAFKDPKTGHFAVVVVNNNTSSTKLNINFAGLKGAPKDVVPYETSAKDNLKALSPVPMTQNGFTATLDGQSVTTFVGN